MTALRTEFEKLVEYATKAPSGHNSQPWIFIITDNCIEIHPDFTRELKVVDSNDRELYISLGCATENLCIAANEYGYNTIYSTRMNNQNRLFIRVELTKGETTKNQLFDQIYKRQTNKSVYNNKIIGHDTLLTIRKYNTDNVVNIRYFERDSDGFSKLKALTYLGNEVQMSDIAFRLELMDWMRFNKKQVDKYQDGLTYKGMGSPAVPAFLGRSIVSRFLKPDKQNASDMQKIESSSHLVLFSTKENNPLNWILLGRALERFLLYLSYFNISAAFMNQACEVEGLRIRMQQEFNLQNEYPSMLLRIGFSNPVPYSPRRSINKVIVNKHN